MSDLFDSSVAQVSLPYATQTDKCQPCPRHELTVDLIGDGSPIDVVRIMRKWHIGEGAYRCCRAFCCC